jgi:hypothetical protein
VRKAVVLSGIHTSVRHCSAYLDFKAHPQSRSDHQAVSVEAGVTNNHQGEHGGEIGKDPPKGLPPPSSIITSPVSVMLFGLAELGYALRLPLPFWMRLVLPSALGIIGVYLEYIYWSGATTMRGRSAHSALLKRFSVMTTKYSSTKSIAFKRWL